MVTEDCLISVQTKETISTLINKFFEILSEPMCSLVETNELNTLVEKKIKITYL